MKQKNHNEKEEEYQIKWRKLLMKKNYITITLLLICMALCITSCGNKKESSNKEKSSEQKHKVKTTINK